ncbi:AIPR family protein [Bacillus velezensis]|uniref:AIPR family protein n=1 Tax=Bacillus velezensis TaxID=492670 RepID=UPI001586F81F|nr:AIPR family protein [Bacillus velezensis]
MQNIIVKNFLHQFKEKFELEEENEDMLFEQFINYCVLNNHVIDSERSFEDMDTGTAKGIDGIAILVNNKLIINEEDIKEIVESKNKFSVDFIFVQSKTSANFNDAKVSYFFRNIEKFINEEECSIKELEKYWEIKNIIYENPRLFKKENPNCIMYYATSSSTTEISADIKETIDEGKNRLNNTGYLSDIIEFYPLGVKEIQKLYRKIDADLEASFLFPKNVTFPYNGEKVTSAYFGLVDIKEYINLLFDKETSGIKNVFEDNIRDYLGVESNDVNTSMQNQLLHEESQLFGLLNNGVTIVADEIRPVGEKFNLINYQIVNGCQTSNVIFDNYNNITERNISLPIRIIATTDENTKNEIITATNSQTGLKPEQLDSLSGFHKMLEEFYNSKNNLVETSATITRDVNIYYERRSNQYRNAPYPQTKIMSIPKQIKAVTSMFIDNPHGVSGHYGTVAKKMKGEIFKQKDFKEPYYVSALLLYRVETFFRKHKDFKQFSRAKWHILMAIKYMLNEKEAIPKHFNSKEILALSKKIEEKISAESAANSLIIQAINHIDQVIKLNNLVLTDRKVFERKETTDKLKVYLKDLNIVNA